MRKIIYTIFIICVNLYSQNVNYKAYDTERDPLTSKINIFTSWKETYQYMRDSKFRFYKKAKRNLTLEFRYRSPIRIYVDRGTPITFYFEDGSEIELTNIQRTVYNPYLMGNREYYDIEVKYKFDDDSMFDIFADNSISNIRFNFISHIGEENFEDIPVSTSLTSVWQTNFSAFREGMQELEELENDNW